MPRPMRWVLVLVLGLAAVVSWLLLRNKGGDQSAPGVTEPVAPRAMRSRVEPNKRSAEPLSPTAPPVTGIAVSGSDGGVGPEQGAPPPPPATRPSPPTRATPQMLAAGAKVKLHKLLVQSLSHATERIATLEKDLPNLRRNPAVTPLQLSQIERQLQQMRAAQIRIRAQLAAE